MGFLDRFKNAITGAPSPAAGPVGPLGLAAGDEVRYYQAVYTVVGTRVVSGSHGVRYQHVLADEHGDRIVLVVRDAKPDSWMLERPVKDHDLPWSAATWEDDEGTTYRLGEQTRERVRLYGDTGIEAARHVITRHFADDDEDGTLVLEDWGAVREARAGEPVYDGQFSFTASSGSAPAEAWDDGEEFEDDVIDAATHGDDDVSRGSPLAAALVLEGRLDVDRPLTAPSDDAEPESYADSEWGDALDVAPEVQQLAVVASVTTRREECPDWLVPTRWVAGSGHNAIEGVSSDWLSPDA